jgi:hypothetical protein
MSIKEFGKMCQKGGEKQWKSPVRISILLDKIQTEVIITELPNNMPRHTVRNKLHILYITRT